MRGVTRILAAVAAAGLTMLVAGPAVAAKPPPSQRQAVQVSGSATYEYVKTCSDYVAPFTCGTYGTHASFYFWIPSAPRQALTLGYVIEDITATNGVDYTGAMAGSVTIPTTQNFAYILLPVANDGVAEGDETLRLTVTSSSYAPDVGQSAVTTLRNDGAIPPDCDLDRPDYADVGLTCAARPAGQAWRLRVTCGDGFTTLTVLGSIVTGNGRSAAHCPRSDHEGRYAFVLV